MIDFKIIIAIIILLLLISFAIIYVLYLSKWSNSTLEQIVKGQSLKWKKLEDKLKKMRKEL
jgi:cobalamin biosynthesis protein CobD/CbiB